MNDRYYVAIMAGGIGSRFWPKSRQKCPKQFLDILGTGETLLQMTYKRFAKIVPEENIFIVTGESYVTLVKEQLPNLDDNQVLAETARRNTAPCIAYMTYKLAAKDPDATFVVAPSDHLITETDDFLATIQKALDHASACDVLMTLGIKPHRPHTGYGYIQYDEEKGGDNIFRVKTFTEKPQLEMAKVFLDSGDFLWNSGIFIWNVRTIIHAFESFQPEIHHLFQSGKEVYFTDQEAAFIKKTYARCRSISIDYAIMEYATNVCVIPSSFGWSDLGTWTSLWEQREKDYLGNAVQGEKVMIYDSENCMVMVPDDKVVILQGLQDYIIVDTGDVLLITSMLEEQQIKEFNATVKRRNGDAYL